MNTIAASTNRVPRVALVGIVALIAAFALLMLIRSGLLGGSSDATTTTAPSVTSVGTTPRPASPQAKPRIVLLPGLPTQVAQRLRYSKVIVVSLYAGPNDRSMVASARSGARQAGAGFTALDVLNEKNARSLSTFAGNVSAPTLLVVRRPGKIINRLPGTVDSAIVTQAAHNAGARR